MTGIAVGCLLCATANGELTFPEAVAGAAYLTVQDVALPDGVLYSETLPVAICTEPQTINLPAEPTVARYTVAVTMPNGQPVVGATVSASGLSSTTGGFDASALGSAGSATRTAQARRRSSAMRRARRLCRWPTATACWIKPRTRP